MTDGPYAETAEVVVGYTIVECASFDRATEIAATLGDTPAPEHVRGRAYVDVRPIMDGLEELTA
ncbi:MAG: YciI family protein [Pseudonocardiaceae bacterium]|nr:YciI family protein [Pseudonocardiaceae bacterium]